MSEELTALIAYIDLLESQSFEGWSSDAEGGYRTACGSIRYKAEKIAEGHVDMLSMEK